MKDNRTLLPEGNEAPPTAAVRAAAVWRAWEHALVAGVQRASAVLVYAGLSERDAAIPTFTVGGAGGVVLHPDHAVAFCGYGVDGSTDYNKPNVCDGGPSDACVPGCGAPPWW